jgi:hypothetical protein
LVDRNTKPLKIGWFTGEFQPFDASGKIEHNPKTMAAQMVVPRGAEAMIAAAVRIARLLRTPFVRVDMYASASGPVIGEITPVPGVYFAYHFRFTEAFDRYLGGLWAEASSRLGREPSRFPVDALTPMARKRLAAGTDGQVPWALPPGTKADGHD